MYAVLLDAGLLDAGLLAKDVAEVLGYVNPRKAVADHCKGGNETLLPSAGGMQEVTIIPERDVYRTGSSRSSTL